MKTALTFAAAVALTGCATTPAASNPQDEFFAALTAHLRQSLCR